MLLPHLSRLLVLGSLTTLCPAFAQQAAPDFEVVDPGPAGAMGSSLDADGSLFLSGAPDAQGGVGHAWLFARQFLSDDQAPVEQFHPDSSNPVQFGASVQLATNRVVVGAPNDNGGRGAVYVFQQTTAWNQVAKLVDPSGQVGDRFGEAISLDGDRLLVGAPGAVSGQGGGAVFDRQPDGTWIHTGTLEIKLPGIVAEGGTAVALYGDNALVGAPGTPWTHSPDAGMVIHYRRQMDGTWKNIDHFRSDNDAATHRFGERMALAGDRLAVYGEDHDQIGDCEYILYELDPQDEWIEESRCYSAFNTPDHPSIAFDGEVLFLGDHNSGALFIQRPDKSWVISLFLSADFPTTPFRSVALTETMFLVGKVDGPGGAWGTYRRTFYRNTDEVSVTTGGDQFLFLRVDPQSVKFLDRKLILGSLSGTTPGLPVPGTSLVLPLNPDSYFDFMLNNLGTQFNWFSPIDMDGFSQAAVTLAAGSSPSLVGTKVHHAAVILELFSGPVKALQVTNAVELRIVP